jgi:hypothetical protein
MSGIFRIPISTLLLTALLKVQTVAAPLQNITIPLPPGSSDHGAPGLICVPTKWTDIVVFFLANYAAHAATTRSVPGERTGKFIVAVVGALLFPASGTFRGILAVLTFAKSGKSSLEIAARAGALCMVVRGPDWSPLDGDTVPNASGQLAGNINEPKGSRVESEELSAKKKPALAGANGPVVATKVEAGNDVRGNVNEGPKREPLNSEMLFWSPHAREIHGSFNIPPGYVLNFVPRKATFIDFNSKESFTSSGTTSVSCSYNSAKILIALGQAIYSIITLYRSRGDQIAQYGYAAFGLTVAPYAVASTLNLLGSLVCPEYPALYLVESTIMQEARRRGAQYFFKGAVGKLDENENNLELLTQDHDDLRISAAWLCILLISIPIAIIGGISRFDKGRSTAAERGWTMAWLSCGMLFGPLFSSGFFLDRGEEKETHEDAWRESRSPRSSLGHLFFILWFAAPAIGGFVVVGRMLNAYGICITVS